MKPLFAVLAAPLLAAGAGLDPGVLVERQSYLMGTTVRMMTVDESRAVALARLDRALAQLEETDAELSTWKPDSALSALNGTPIGKPWRAGPSLCRVLTAVWTWQRETGGAFDPAIGPLLDAWAVHRGGRLPDAREIETARAQSGLAHLDFDAARCEVVRQRGVSIDAGAFGKGEALDRASAAGPWRSRIRRTAIAPT